MQNKGKKPESHDKLIGELVIKHLGANLYKIKDLIAIRNLAIEFSKSQFKQPIAEGETVYRKASVKKRPSQDGIYDTNLGKSNFYEGRWLIMRHEKIIYWLEETTLPSVKMPSDEEIKLMVETRANEVFGENPSEEKVHYIVGLTTGAKLLRSQITLSKGEEKKEGEVKICIIDKCKNKVHDGCGYCDEHLKFYFNK